MSPAGHHGRGGLRLHRHRRHRRGGRVPADPAGPAARGGPARGRALHRGVVGRGLPGRRDEGLRGEVLAALQGNRQAGVRHSRQPRLVRRARGVRGHVHDRGGRPADDAGADRGRQPAHQHHGRADRGADRPGRAASPAVRGAHGVPARALLPGPDARLRAAGRRHRGEADRSTRPSTCGSRARWPRRAARSRWSSSVIPSTQAATTWRRATTTFLALHRLLREHGVAIVMAGDTHDLEYYVERGEAGGRESVAHVVNGGGGAYLSFGTALDWPAAPATRRLGVPPDDRAGHRKDPGDPPALEDALLVVDPVPGRLAVLGRVALGGVRRQRRAVLPELRGGPGGTLVGPRPSPPVRDQRPPPLDGSPDVVGAPARRGGAGGSGRVEPGPGRTLSGPIPLVTAHGVRS